MNNFTGTKGRSAHPRENRSCVQILTAAEGELNVIFATAHLLHLVHDRLVVADLGGAAANHHHAVGVLGDPAHGLLEIGHRHLFPLRPDFELVRFHATSQVLLQGSPFMPAGVA